MPSPSSSQALGCRELSPLGKAALAIGTTITVVALIPMIDLQVVWRCALKRELGNSVPRADHSGHAKDQEVLNIWGFGYAPYQTMTVASLPTSPMIPLPVLSSR